MVGSFTDIVDEMIKAGDPNIGTVFIRMLEICHTFHVSNLLLVDIKAGNFMLAVPPPTACAMGTNDALSPTAFWLAARLCVIDLGLVQRFHVHRQNYKDGELVGTPLYASLHDAHEGGDPGFRDDLFSVGLFLAEELIRCYAIVHGKSSWCDVGENPMFLPWANKQSDHAIACAKQQVLDRHSKFYSCMSDDSANIMIKFLTCANGMQLDEFPDHNSLCNMV